MKSFVFVLIGLLVVSNTQSVSMSYSLSGNTEDLSDFLNGAFDALNTTMPAEAIECFSDGAADLIFEYLDLIGELLNAFYTSGLPGVEQYQAAANNFNIPLQNVGACLKNMSADFMYLATVFSPAQLAQIQTDLPLFEQVDQQTFYNDYLEVLAYIREGQYYNAGALLANVFTVDAIESVNADGLVNDEWRDFLTGQYFALNLSEPTDLFECFNSDDAQSNLQLISSLASTIANLTLPANITEVMITFFEAQSANINITSQMEIFTCVNNSASNAAFQHALGLPSLPTPGPAQANLLNAYFNNPEDAYTFYYLMTSMNQLLQEQQYFGAGGVMGSLLRSQVQAIEAMMTSSSDE